jgi:hypothetical protein
MSYVVVKSERMPGLVTQWGKVIADHGNILVVEHMDFAKEKGRHIRAHHREAVILVSDEALAKSTANDVALAFSIRESATATARNTLKARLAELSKRGEAA